MKRFWDVRSLAEFFGLPLSWVYERTRREGPDTIPHLKFGKYVRFDPESESFQAWLRRHERGTVVGLPTQRRL